MYNLKINFLDFIPKTFFNLFKYNKEAKEKSNTSFLITSHVLLDDKTRFLLIYKKLIKKKKIFNQQHGSAYQEVLKNLNLMPIIEDKISTQIFWGNANRKKICLPSPQISKINVNYHKKKILFISHPNMYFAYAGHPVTHYKVSMQRIELTLKFLKSLDKNIKDKIYYKYLYRHFVEKDLIKKKIKEINFTNTKPEKLLNKVRLVILNYHNTMFLKCIGGNIPTVLVNNNFNDLNHKARKIYKRLEENNIIFRNAKEAANFINKNYDNIYHWWNKKSVQNSVKLFSYNYCFTKQNWFKDWYNFFRNNKFK